MKKYLLFILIFVLCLCGCSKKASNSVMGDSLIFVENEKLFFTNEKGDLCTYSLIDEAVEKIIGEFYIQAYNDRYFVGYKDNVVKVFDRQSKAVTEIENITAEAFCICDDTIYYTDSNDNNYIYQINASDRQQSVFLQESTGRIAVSGDYIIYEKDKNSIYKCNIENRNTERLFEGKYCFYFYADDENVYLSNYEDNGKISVINADRGECERTYDVPSINFFVCENAIYYLPLVNEDDYHKERECHIYKYDIQKNDHKKIYGG